MGVPCTALWAVLFSVAWAPTGAPGPTDLYNGFLTVEFPPARALHAQSLHAQFTGRVLEAPGPGMPSDD